MDLLDFTIGLQRYMDKRGFETYIMFHGTTLRNALQIIQNGFVPSWHGMLGPGVYVTRSFQKASAYPKHPPPGEEQAILQLSVHVGKVIKINYQGHPLQKTWHQAGYDTAWVPPNCGMVPSGLEENCVWDPQRIQVLAILDRNGCPKNPFGFGHQCPAPPIYPSPCPVPIVPPMMPNPYCMPPPFLFPCPPAMPPPWWFP